MAARSVLLLIILGICVYTLAQDIPGVADNAERLAYDNIFRDYDPNIRPRNLPEEVVDVQILLSLQSLSGFDSVNQIVHNQVLIYARWFDDFLTWERERYGGLPYMVVPATDVWRPDFGLQNSAGDFYKESYWRDYRVKIAYDGEIEWSFGGIFSTSCSLDISNYPFDEQTCNITLSNWAYYDDDVQLHCLIDDIEQDNYEEDGQWALVGTYCGDKPDVVSDEITLSRITFQLDYRRKTFWYEINIIIPSLLMIVLVLMMFWLPPESGEKIGMGVTILLAFSVFQLLIASEIPKTSDTTPMLSGVMLFVMIITTLSIVNTIIVLRLHHHSPSRRPPKLIRYIAFGILAKPLCLSYILPADYGKVAASDTDSKDQSLEDFKMNYENKTNEDSEASVKPAEPVMPGGELSEILHNVESIKDILKDDADSASTRDEWQDIATVVERTMFWVVLIVVAIYIPYMFISAAT